MNELYELLSKLMWGQLQSIGLFTQKETKITNLKTKLSKLYSRWLDESIAVLAERNYLRYDGESCTVLDPKPLDINAAWHEWEQRKEIWLEDPNMRILLILVEKMLRVLPDILTGKVAATDVMFPGSSMELVEGIYKNNMVADYFNEVVADTVVAYLEDRLQQKPSTQIRIIEIGAGTGGTSVMVFRKLKPYQAHIKEYCYTDVSKAFLIHAEREYGPQNPYLSYKIFNVEAPPAGQGIQAGGYDVVIAANVLHATKNIRQTLRNTKAALKKNGLLILNELNGNSLLSHLTSGLLEGWWLYEDGELRIPGSPALSPQAWQMVLESEGFRSVFFPAEADHEFGFQIIVAESDGVVRQKQADPPGKTVVASGAKTMANWPQDKLRHRERRISKTMASDIGVTVQMVEDHIRETIIEKLSESLKVEINQIDVDESFADYGLDSITGIHLVQIINRGLAIELTTTNLFDYSSVNQLTKYIVTQYKDMIVTALSQNVTQTNIEEDVNSPEPTFENAPENEPVDNSPQPLPRQRTVREIEITERAAETEGSISKEAIAIIGMSGRYAKSKTVNELWEYLAKGTDLVEEVGRWKLPKDYLAGPNNCKHGSFIEDIDQFDPYFFNISALEATYMDPAQRFFLEESWKALEDAGYAGTMGGRLCGVYLGFNGGDYGHLIMGQPNPPAQAMWGNSNSIIPARISYYLNLQGPAITVDTACSSSLVAIHLACQGLWAGETEMALAGGVAISCTPGFYLLGGRAGMLSGSGRCHTFDERADGFVPGEGVGVVVLKRLQEAIRDGDHIYGVIRGTGINQDGTTNGITAPSANSQERLERYVYDTFHIHPEQIQVVEAHGTGTKLGDPIEYEALTRAFQNYTDKEEYCALGSIKTNLGHTLAAAGVTGLIKILLSLRYKKIPASLHFERGNSRIKFKGSPFYVNTRLKDWEVEAGRKRCAAISAFGFSGTNAHMVIEEAPVMKREHSEKPGFLIVVSARTSEQLRLQVKQMVDFCEQEALLDMGNMSYTLLLGRRHFNHRLACVTRSREELVNFLKKWLEKGKVTQVYVSELNEKDHRELLSLKQYGNQCLQNCQFTSRASDYLEQLATIAELYIQGYELDFGQLFTGEQYGRISLPTYPFAREHYWIPEEGVKFDHGIQATGITSFIHPLLHQNTSDLSKQRYSSIFTGEEFFLADHVVKGQRVLPGVVYLEMARAAVKEAVGAAGFLRDKPTRIRLKNVVWARPITVEDQPVQVHIALFPEENGEISYEIYTSPCVHGVSHEQGAPEKITIESIVHCQGRAMLNLLMETPSLDLNDIQARCNQNTFSSVKVYQFLKELGFGYGPGHQGIEQVYVGRGQLLAKLSLPASVSDTKDQYVLHPSIMDAALQAAAGFMMDACETGILGPLKPVIPFALEELEIYGPCVSPMWVLIRFDEITPRGHDDQTVDKLRKFNIDLCDNTEKICVRLKGYTSRVFDLLRTPDSSGILMLQACWKERMILPEPPVPSYVEHRVILCELEDIYPSSCIQESLETEMNGIAQVSYCRSLQSSRKGINKRFESYATQVFEELQSILKEKKPADPILLQVVIPNQGERQLFSGLSGLLKTARLENPRLIGQIIEVDPAEDPSRIPAKLKENGFYPTDQQIRYRDGKRYIATWCEVETTFKEDIPWKDGGVYLITGGTGGLGLVFAGEIARKAKGATVILVGRSEPGGEKQSRLKELQDLGARIEYKQVDVADKKAVGVLFQGIREEFGGLNGIIHSAGVIKDSFIIKKTKDEILEVLAPKVTGLVNLDGAGKDLPLDFFILFSSMAGSMGNPGQADYSTANAFMDAYARYRNRLVASNQRQGRTLSINWPLWQEGGMHVDMETEKMMQQNTGMIAMQTQTGIQALYQAFNFGKDQVMVMEGDLNRLRTAFFGPANQAALNTPAHQSTAGEEKRTGLIIEEDILKEKATNYFKKLLSAVIQLPADRIDADAPIEKYGIDSIMVMQLTNELEKYFGSLSKTLFFEYQTIRELTGYFLESYRGQMIDKLGMAVKNAVIDANEPATKLEPITPVPAISSRRHSRFGVFGTPSPDKTTGALDIAIIGVSGRYPQAQNIREFWKNLREGRDCITEIPKDRWDYRLYFDNDKNKAGKTYSKWGGFLEGVDQFDPLFFNISPREAEIMDPQERLFLECVYETLEDAGYTRQGLGERQSLGEHQGPALGSNVGVYVGVMYEEYQLYGAQEQIQGRPVALAGNPASIANRVSYFCNFHGPSMAVDTMCSSSLTAIHLACQSLQRGECELAVAGGVNVSVHPNKYLMLAQGKFASSKGWCESFGEGGDGYVPGEGVGAVLLKPLAEAIAAGDHIYGVIKGTAVNHGGKTNGYSVPNPNAQVQVIGRALKVAGIDPRTISYIEAHGTGTSLGDPIEITGLTKAFREYTRDNQFCAIGSVKSNIGHCESAAGIAGVTKVLLQLQNGEIVPSLHSEILNPNIDFSNTPFVVQQTLTDWNRSVINDGELPRRAGVSSFGAGGSNAHVVIEEYIPKGMVQPLYARNPATPVVIVLSARTEERLCEQVRRLLAAVKERQFTDADLDNIAYTLQIGREAMEERLTVIVGTIQELVEKLREFMEGRHSIDELYRGQVKSNKETLNVLITDEEMREAVDKWIQRKKYGKLLELWVKGLVFDWNKLYGDVKPRRISLPSYPFARERYWVPEIGPQSGRIIPAAVAPFPHTAALHPLLHQNTSDLSEQRFSSTFTGGEFFLADHIIKGQRVLPGVAYLEMARVAVVLGLGAMAAGALEDGQTGIRLKNVVWVRPVTVGDHPVQLHIGLFPEENGEIVYRIYTSPHSWGVPPINGASGMDDAKPVIHSEGSVALISIHQVPTLDLAGLQAQCIQNNLSSTEVYEAFKAMGLEYGPGHQGIEQIYVGQGQVLARLSLPISVLDTKDQFVLHPSIMDAALQAAIGFMTGVDDTNNIIPLKPALPFALQELEIFSRATSQMWAVIGYNEAMPGDHVPSGSANKTFDRAQARVRKLNIDLCDDTGKICIRIKGYTSRVVEGEIGSAETSTTTGTLMVQACWKEQSAVPETPAPDYTHHLVMIGELENVLRENIEAQMNGIARVSRCLNLQSKHKDIDKRFEVYAAQVFEEVQSILKDKPAGRILIQIVIPNQGEHQLLGGLSGLLKTAALENPKLTGQIIEVDPREDSGEIAAKLIENSRCPADQQIRYQDGKRYISGWNEVKASRDEKEIPWKDQGVYLISGGAGGLGLIFAKEIACQVKSATVVLTGRSELNKEKQSQLEELQDLGIRITYKQVDVTDKKAVTGLIQDIRNEFGGLHGIIHTAGVIKDNFIIKKTKDELFGVLAPKVGGLVNLDEASKDLPLDFFICFSSLAGSLGNPGQADYSAANAFMDAYARYRNMLVASKQRQGYTLSINWPLWKEGGMHITPEAEKLMMQNTGMLAMQTRTGTHALYQAFRSGKDQVMVMEGSLNRLRAVFFSQPAPGEALNTHGAESPLKEENQTGPVVDQDILREKAVNYFKKLLSSFLKLPANRIEADALMEKYGIDSVLVMQLTNELEKTFGSLSKTLFFEYQTIREVTEYFLESHRLQLIELLGVEAKAAVTTEKDSRMAAEVMKLPGGGSSRPRFGPLYSVFQPAKSAGALDIAIIGVAGRYPGARNIREFWGNLRDGRDCITEIPKDRWDHSVYFDEDKNKFGKIYTKWGGFLEGVDQFDPLFFNISPREAEIMDPQERLFLECVYETLEDAGYTREALGKQQGLGPEGNVGVYVGVMYEEYQLYGAQEQIRGRAVALSGNPSSIANRVSYFCNFHGPSVAVDTMCSSSLTAIHFACQSLQRGSCELAIAGGVNVSIHPNKYLILAQGKFASSKGRCESFGEGGDGYVPGEGVGAVLLKPLSKAVADGDHIYGVIKGTAINHGGKTNGYTVPNPNAQAGVIGQALKEAGIDPRTISYIEAHGTGTTLGDPIEITGLTKAFRDYTGENKFCAIGSAKSNIGHCESAAGIAGITKVLLQLKYGQLAPSLHSKVLNPNIDFEHTPFIVQRTLAEWKRPVVNDLEFPRRAGVSSFGAGGANAHVVIEEYVPKAWEPSQITVIPGNPVGPVVIVLSAKNEKRLGEQAQRLLATIQAREFFDNNLADMAYTLQVGREAMEERLAIIVNSLPELEEKLQGFLEDRDGIGDLYRGQARRNQEAFSVFSADEDLQKAIDAWVTKGKYGKLLDLWVKGLIFDWNKLYGDIKPHRISLPTYPFARESYWVPEIDIKPGSVAPNSNMSVFPCVHALHPLLHHNISDLSEQRYSSTFTGEEFFIGDHTIKGQRLFPEAAGLEMARVAVASASGVFTDDQTEILLKNVLWAQPIVVGDHPVQIHIALFPEEDGEIAYEIYTVPDDGEVKAEPAVHSQGTAVLVPNTKAPTLDLKGLQDRCNQSTFSSAQVYMALKTMGIDYEPEHQGIELIYNGQGQALAKICLPACVANTKDTFILHPGIMDPVLQAIISLTIESGNPKPTIPFKLHELEIFGKCTSPMWALIRYIEGKEAEETEDRSRIRTRVSKFDVDLCDEQGTVLVRIKGLETRENTDVKVNETIPPVSLETSNTQEAYEIMTFEEVWREESLRDWNQGADSLVCPKTLVCFLSNPENQQVFTQSIQSHDQQTVIIFISQGAAYQKQTRYNYSIAATDCNTYREAFQSIGNDFGEVDATCCLWPLEEPGCVEDYSRMVYVLQAMGATKLAAGRVLFTAQYENELERCYIESWIGFERSLQLIMPNTQIAAIFQAVSGQILETVVNDLALKLWAELRAKTAGSVLYQDGKRYVCQIRPNAIKPGNNLLKPGGTYLITGGCGGLGLLFAEHLAKRSGETQPVNLILTGRSPLNTEKQSKIKALENLGSQVMYIQADVSNSTRMKKGLQQARERFGNIRGVVHAAGIAGKQNIFEKEIRSFQQVLAPKVKGTLILDELTREDPLDFICYFSSSSAILGDFGSCDYAIGNRFLMAYAHYRNRQHQKGQRPGKAIVINWPLWKDGGMGIGADENNRMYLKSSGQRILETEEGLAIFDQILSQDSTQYLVLAGQPSRIHRFLGLTGGRSPRSSPVFSGSSPGALSRESGRRPEIKGLSIAQCLEWDLKEQISQLLKISRDKLDRDENLADFGFDSVSLAQLANSLSNHYRIEVTPALFFGYSTIEKLTHYFLSEYKETIEEFYREDPDQPEFAQPAPDSAVPAAGVISRPPERRLRFAGKSTCSGIPEPIAIIGMSGRFPGARNIEELWAILATGQDMIKEIPEERLEWLKYNAYTRDLGINFKCGCIPGVSEFEPLFFEISPKEAETMDPRQRLLLQESWKALEDASYGAEQIKTQKIGMFVGVEQGDYQLLTNGEGSITANHNAILASRLAYFLNLNGPVMAIDTACSSGLVATHQAILSLRSGECDTAIAAGVNLLLAPESYIGLSQAGMLSEDGKCRAFDKRADGMVPGEAVAVVILKRLSRAEADSDPIYAVIKGSSINYDGKTNGITAPSGVSQTSLLKTVYDQYRVNPEEIEYIVTHGTGTKLGDPIEINALYDAFKGYTRQQGYCALSSTKTNFGHTFAASGLVSLISLVQALRHGTIPASLHCETENDYINWKESPFFVNKANKPWPDRIGKSGTGITRTGAVSAFGMSGTNAHMVLQSYSPKEKAVSGHTSPDQPPYFLLALSAKTRESLVEKIKDMIEVLQNDDIQAQDLLRISYTLLKGRQHFNHRCAIVIRDREDGVYVLKQAGGKEKLPNLFQGKVPRDFTGQRVIEQYAQNLINMSRTATENGNRYQEILYGLADLYCQGYELDWKHFFIDNALQRIHLPTYPFIRERYWVAETGYTGDGIVVSSMMNPVTDKKPPIRRTIYLLNKRWEQCLAAQIRSCNRVIAILATAETVELAAQLGKCFAKTEILQLENLELPLKQPEQEWKNYDGCIDLAGCGTGMNPILTWIPWLQQLIEHGRREGLTMLCVTKGLESFQNSNLNLSGASRAGLYRMLQSEYHHVKSRHMDTDLLTDDNELARQIASEFLMESGEPEICYRQGVRYRACLQEISNEVDADQTVDFPEEHVLWITGGTRGLGYLCARHFVKHYGVKRLVVTGQEIIPPRDQWDLYMDQNTSIAEKIRAIRDLEAQGANVQVLSVSLADQYALEQHLQEVKSTMGPIGGIIHCAGICDLKNPAFIRKSMDGIQRVLEPKVAGLDTIYQVFAKEPLQFFILFSSISAIVPSLASGQSDYVMANAYMDYFAEAAHVKTPHIKDITKACPVFSIQWPSWKETGMGEVKSRAYELTGLLSITNEEGLSLFDRILAGKPGPVVIPAVVNPELWRPDRLMQRWIEEGSPANIRPRSVVTDQSTLSTGFVKEVENWLVDLFAKELKIDPSKLETDTPFQDYGVDSIMLAQLLRVINQWISEELDPSMIYEYPTIELFAARIAGNYTSSIAKTLGFSVSRQLESLIQESLFSLPSEKPRASIEGTESVFSRRNTIKPPDIAVIGLSCRFPGSDTLEQYWQLLSEGRSAIGPVPPERWGYSRRTNADRFYAGLLNNITHFDPSFFLIPEEDVKVMDPQALVMLEESLKLWYHAGYTHQEMKGKSVGVYIGGRSRHEVNESSLRQARNPIVALAQNYLAANISQFFDLRGPSVVVDTACSSALVAMDLAIKALVSRDIESAMVGGVNLLTSDGTHHLFEQRGILNMTSSYHIFDKRANGAILGEGAGMVLLKTVEQALADGDNIYAVIKGLAINNDGRTPGPATPNIQAQKEVIQSALAKSGKTAGEISYIEANGSGSEVTDLLELKAIQSVYRSSNVLPLGLGSIKPNIGHPLCAEGIAGFIKIVMMMQNKQFVPFLSGEQPLEYFDVESSPIYFSRKTAAWTTTPLTAGLNCFADGGTNAHVILEAWPELIPRQVKRRPIPPPELNRYDIHHAEVAPVLVNQTINRFWNQG